MAQKLYNDTSVSAIADAIRSIDGDATLMKIADMPSRIQALMEHATTSKYGIVKLATQAEAGDTSNAEAVITPATMSSLCHPNVISGLIQFIENNQTEPVTDSLTPAEIEAMLLGAVAQGFPAATESVAGKITLAQVRSTAVTNLANGVRLGNGFMVQCSWTQGSQGRVVYPTAFTAWSYPFLQINSMSSEGPLTCCVTASDPTGFDFDNRNRNNNLAHVNFCWFAIGV